LFLFSVHRSAFILFFLETAEGEIAVDLVDASVAIDMEFDSGEDFGELFFEAPDDFVLESLLDLGGDLVESGDAGLDHISPAVPGADADAEGGAEIKESIVFAVVGGEGGGTSGMAMKLCAETFVFEFGVDFIEDLFESVFPAFEAGFGGGHRWGGG